MLSLVILILVSWGIASITKPYVRDWTKLGAIRRFFQAFLLYGGIVLGLVAVIFLINAIANRGASGQMGFMPGPLEVMIIVPMLVFAPAIMLAYLLRTR